MANHKDIPRGGFTCRSYRDGHNVHYEAVMKSVPRHAPEEARIQFAEDQISVEVDGVQQRVYTHNPSGIGQILFQLQKETCLWFPALRLACWTTPTERHWVSLAADPVTACFSAEEAFMAEVRRWCD